MKTSILKVVLIFSAAINMWSCADRSGMKEVKFSLGSNILETAQTSGIPKFEVEKVSTSIEYSTSQLPPELPVKYSKPGFEVTIKPVFAFSLHANSRRTANDAVYAATIQVESESLTTHTSAATFVRDIISQFNKGKWERHIRSSCPAVSGRSSLLNATGELNSEGCALDPSYQISASDWLQLFRTRQTFEWLGDGIIAKLTAGYDEDIRGLTYTIFLEFEDEKTMAEVDAENESRERKSGDAKGWNTSVEAEKEIKENAEKIRVLELNALQRGDKVLARRPKL